MWEIRTSYSLLHFLGASRACQTYFVGMKISISTRPYIYFVAAVCFFLPCPVSVSLRIPMRRARIRSRAPWLKLAAWFHFCLSDIVEKAKNAGQSSRSGGRSPPGVVVSKRHVCLNTTTKLILSVCCVNCACDTEQANRMRPQRCVRARLTAQTAETHSEKELSTNILPIS